MQRLFRKSRFRYRGKRDHISRDRIHQGARAWHVFLYVSLDGQRPELHLLRADSSLLPVVVTVVEDSLIGGTNQMCTDSVAALRA